MSSKISIKQAIVELELVNLRLIADGITTPELAGLELGAGIRMLKAGGVSRAKMLEVVGMLFDDDNLAGIIGESGTDLAPGEIRRKIVKDSGGHS